MPPLLFLYAVVALFLGLIVFLIARSNRKLREEGIHTMGTVIGYQEEVDRDDQRTLFYPIIRFRNQYNIEQEATLNLGKNHQPYELGSTMEIVYDPENPSRITTV
jgi:hypothetical protein